MTEPASILIVRRTLEYRRVDLAAVDLGLPGGGVSSALVGQVVISAVLISLGAAVVSAAWKLLARPAMPRASRAASG